jgi:hypothetical protein
MPMAETWLRRTIGLARRSGEWAAYGGALTVLGRLLEGAERLADAHAEYRMAFLLGRRRSLGDIYFRAASALLRIALRTGDHAEAEMYAAIARRPHGRLRPDRGGVLLDVAELELRLGRCAEAAKLLGKALAGRMSPGEQVRALTMLVRAEGGRGDRKAVQDAWHRAVALIDACTTSDGPRLLLCLARAGAEVMEDAQADVAAYRALQWATRLGDEALAAECQAFLARTRLPPATS